MAKKFIPEVRPNEKNIVIIGLPATGKSFLAQLLWKHLFDPLKSKGAVTLYESDDYIKYGFEEALYIMMKEILKDRTPIKIVEGVQGYRLLRKGVELGSYYPDLVITCIATTDERKKRYIERGKALNTGLDKTLFKIWNDYQMLLKHVPASIKPPRFITYDTLTGKSS